MTATPGAAEYEVIVHGSGQFEDPEESLPYWTEVPAMAACMAEGSAPEEAVQNTRDAIERWLAYSTGEAPEPFTIHSSYAF